MLIQTFGFSYFRNLYQNFELGRDSRFDYSQNPRELS